MWAAGWNQHPEVIMTLLKAGADAKAKDKWGMTAFDYAQGNEKLKGTLGSLARPAALVASDHTVLFSNNRLRKMLKKSNLDVVGLRIGEVLDCKNAASPSRCGETALCPHCGLKRLIELTRITGERLNEIPISVQHRSGASKTFKITTEKAGEAVLLIIAGLRADV